jgi:hypothetical protein
MDVNAMTGPPALVFGFCAFILGARMSFVILSSNSIRASGLPGIHV